MSREGLVRFSKAIRHAFLKPSLVNLISKGSILVFYLSVYKLVHSTSDYDVIIECRVHLTSLITSFKEAYVMLT